MLDISENKKMSAVSELERFTIDSFTWPTEKKGLAAFMLDASL